MAAKKKDIVPSGPISITESVVKGPKEKWQADVSLNDLDRHICNCTKCRLGVTRTKFVFGVGNPKADLLVIGEAKSGTNFEIPSFMRRRGLFE